MRFLLAMLLTTFGWGGEPVSIRFRAVAGDAPLLCGQKYGGIGVTGSTITPRDFRFYIHDLQLINEQGNPVPVELDQDDKWQTGNVTLLDFENATGSCRNGSPDMHTAATGQVPPGKYRGLRFTLGVPVDKNHTDLMAMPSPLNLTALSWVWNAGRKFARLDFSSTGNPRGYLVHLGSTGCVDGRCASPNRFEIALPTFDPSRDTVLADLAALLKNVNVDEPAKDGAGCMSSPETPACGPILANFKTAFFRLP